MVLIAEGISNLRYCEQDHPGSNMSWGINDYLGTHSRAITQGVNL